MAWGTLTNEQIDILFPVVDTEDPHDEPEIDERDFAIGDTENEWGEID